MAGERNKDLLSRLADLSEEAIQRLSEAPGADRLFQTLNGLRDRVDELQKRVRGFEALEQRLAALEKKVDRLAKAQSTAPPRRRRAAAGPKRGTTSKNT